MKIVHVCQPTDGGAAAVASDLVRAAAESGYDVTLVAPAGGFLAERAKDLGVRWVELPMGRAPALRDLRLTWLLRAILRDADVAHLHSSKAGALGRLAGLTLGSARPRTVFTPHGWSWYVGGRLATVYRAIERALLRATDVITVVSAGELRDGRTTLGPRAPLELVENGVDVRSHTPDGPVADRAPDALVVQVGRLSVQKGQDRAIRALARLQDPSARLRLIGEGPLRAELTELAAELDVSDRVEFLGTQDPRSHLRAADVVILPSRWEGMPLTLLEAMASGAAVITSDCGGSEALGDTGLRIAHRDDEPVVDGLVEHLQELLADPEQRAHLGRAARIRAVDNYSLELTLQRYREIWRQPSSRMRQAGHPRVTSPESAHVAVETPTGAVGLGENALHTIDR